MKERGTILPNNHDPFASHRIGLILDQSEPPRALYSDGAPSGRADHRACPWSSATTGGVLGTLQLCRSSATKGWDGFELWSA
jgi:hypothetical protein